MMGESSSPRKSEYELLRERNIREREALFASDDECGEFSSVSEALNAVTEYSNAVTEYSQTKNPPKSASKRKRRSNGDASFTFSGQIPLERRRSSRLAKYDPEFNYKDLPDKEGSIRSSDRGRDSGEFFRQNKIRIRFRSKTPKPMQVDGKLRTKEFTEEDFENISERTSDKIYSTNGTTCHQCRQKTLDTKSFCHNYKCFGVQGQVCGPCLRNRYGEEVADTLRDPTWICPYCRNECNCSFCRQREGKCPTGILAPNALDRGFKSVYHLLVELENKKTKSEDDEEETDRVNVKQETKKNEETLKEVNEVIIKQICKIAALTGTKQNEIINEEDKDLRGITVKGEYVFA